MRGRVDAETHSKKVSCGSDARPCGHITSYEGREKKGGIVARAHSKREGWGYTHFMGGRIEKRDEGRSESANGTMDDGRRGMGYGGDFLFLFFLKIIELINVETHLFCVNSTPTVPRLSLVVYGHVLLPPPLFRTGIVRRGNERGSLDAQARLGRDRFGSGFTLSSTLTYRGRRDAMSGSFFFGSRARVVSRISFFFLGGGQFFPQKKFFFRREKMVFQGFLGVFRAFSTKPRSHQENPIPQSFRISWWYVASVRV